MHNCFEKGLDYSVRNTSFIASSCASAGTPGFSLAMAFLNLAFNTTSSYSLSFVNPSGEMAAP